MPLGPGMSSAWWGNVRGGLWHGLVPRKTKNSRHVRVKQFNTLHASESNSSSSQSLTLSIIPQIPWNFDDFFYRVHKGPALKSVLSKINPAIITPYFFMIHFDITLSSEPKSLTWSINFGGFWRKCYMHVQFNISLHIPEEEQNKTFTGSSYCYSRP
jgi:hypothetical protein